MEEVFSINFQSHGTDTRLKLKSKPYELCKFAYTFGATKNCVAWSSDNVLAVAMSEGVWNPNSSSHNQIFSYPIYIVRVGAVSSGFTSIVTPHSVPIKHLEWAPLDVGTVLLSNDGFEKVCIWKTREHSDDWVCVHTFSLESVVAIKFLTTFKKFTPILSTSSTSPFNFYKNSDLTVKSREPSFPPGSLAFVTLSITGVVTFMFHNTFENTWQPLTCQLGFPIVQAHGIQVADITITSNGTIEIAWSGSSMGNTISVYEVVFDYPNQVVNNRLKSRLDLPYPRTPTSPPLRPFFTLQDKVPSPVYVLFDKNDSNTLLSISCGVEPRSESRLFRYVYTSEPILQKRKFLSQSRQDLEKVQELIWVPSGISKLNRNPQAAILQTCISSGFVMCLASSISNILFIGFLNGDIEARDSITLQKLALDPACDPLLIEDPSTNENFTLFSRPLRIPLSISVSPHGYCVSVLYYDGLVKTFLTHPPLESTQTQEIAQFISHLFQSSIVNGMDWWEPLQHLKSYRNPVINNYVYLYTMKDFQTLDPSHSRLYTVQMEYLKIVLFSGQPGHEVNVIDSQSRSILLLALDAFRSILSMPLKMGSSPPLTEKFDDIIGQSSPYLLNLNPPPHSAGSSGSNAPHPFLSLIAVGEWVLDLVVFLLRNLTYFLTVYKDARFTATVSSSSANPSVPMQTSPQILTPSIHTPSSTPSSPYNETETNTPINLASSTTNNPTPMTFDTPSPLTNALSAVSQDTNTYLEQFSDIDARSYFPIFAANHHMQKSIPLISLLISHNHETLSTIRELLIYCCQIVLSPVVGNANAPKWKYSVTDVKAMFETITRINERVIKVIDSEIEASAIDSQLTSLLNLPTATPNPSTNANSKMIQPSRILNLLTSLGSAIAPVLTPVNLPPPVSSLLSQTVDFDSAIADLDIGPPSSSDSPIPSYCQDAISRIKLGSTKLTGTSVRQCIRCHRISWLRIPSNQQQQLWYDRWTKICPVCGGSWIVRGDLNVSVS